MSLSEEISRSAGQPVTARVGVVVGVSPLQVDVQGTIFSAPNLGVVGTVPSLGDNVLLLGQAVKGSKSSGSSWVVLGRIVSA